MQWMPKVIYDVLLFFTFGLFLAITFLYGRKAIHHIEEVAADFKHRIRINFFSAISISFLLLSIAFLGFWPFLSMIFWWVGLLLHTVLMFYTISFWIQHNFEIQFIGSVRKTSSLQELDIRTVLLVLNILFDNVQRSTAT